MKKATSLSPSGTSLGKPAGSTLSPNLDGCVCNLLSLKVGGISVSAVIELRLCRNAQQMMACVTCVVDSYHEVTHVCCCDSNSRHDHEQWSK